LGEMMTSFQLDVVEDSFVLQSPSREGGLPTSPSSLSASPFVNYCRGQATGNNVPRNARCNVPAPATQADAWIPRAMRPACHARSTVIVGGTP
jgi:hypothetical protein